MKISVVGAGYVGLSLAVLISRKHNVIAYDIIPEKVKMINSGKSPIVDVELSEYLSSNKLNLKATTDINKCKGSDYIIIATPTNYNIETKMFDTSSVINVITQLEEITPESVIIIKSTIPIGFTESITKRMGVDNILFSPEFLREGKALYDNLHPSRIIVGVPSNNKKTHEYATGFLNLLLECAEEKAEARIMNSTEAESVKLFSNAYLAMRVSFFNELDSFALSNNLDAQQIIEGVCLDSRIGENYNNPSFGYGGYCLPKDTKQLLDSYKNVPGCLIEAIVKSNDVRKQYIADFVKKMVGKKNATIGIFRLTMKTGSDNFRESCVFDIMNILHDDGYKIVVYEPLVSTDNYDKWTIDNDLQSFSRKCDVILANRKLPELGNLKVKVLCRDIFNRD